MGGVVGSGAAPGNGLAGPCKAASTVMKWTGGCGRRRWINAKGCRALRETGTRTREKKKRQNKAVSGETPREKEEVDGKQEEQAATTAPTKRNGRQQKKKQKQKKQTQKKR